MYETRNFGYLALQKTGSTFIIDFLTRFGREQRLPGEKHGYIKPGSYDPAKFYFISVRNTLEQYTSLYLFGLSGRGRVYSRLREHGCGAFYDGTTAGFQDWLSFVLEPFNARFLESKYADSGIAGLTGYQSYRYLKLAIPSATKVFQSCKSEGAIRKALQERNIVQYAIRNERLNQDLAELASTKLRDSLKDVDKALAYLGHAPRLNESRQSIAQRAALTPGQDLERRLRRREWLLHELFGY